MHLDIPSVMFLSAVSCLSIAVAMFVVAGHYPVGVSQAMRRWGEASAALALGAAFIFFRTSVPDFLSVVLGNTLIVTGFGLAYLAIRSLHGRPATHDRWVLVWVLLCFALYGGTFVSDDDINLRIVLVSVLKLPVLLMIVRELWAGGGNGRRPIEGLLIVVYLAYALVSGVRAVDTMSGGDLSHSSFFGDPMQQFSIIAFFLTVSVSSLFFMLALGEVLTAELYQRATTDALTGIYNRHAFEELASREIARSQRTGRYPSMLMVDIDHFKRINDRCGHATGDAVLCAVVGAIQGALRQQDFVGRWGGEEFCILLPETGRLDALMVAERLRTSVMELPAVDASKMETVTVSIGVTCPYDRDSGFSAMLAAADEALYKAKFGGRNRVVMAGV
ncbi:GGDEF domain-containing protein [Denitromonas iodatirespirans]|uniref:diguanylate cyclase n=1 Tax=Denitromonas iodatirespirans TaxID=2795389 RepID=A0A944D468_DENI1|nr:GGDEF domain-containing protein [Denitromonas iodatirespirans]MBT0959624.1 GGDEF domain-containing protein [Denitromonas iodatirespirans]